jgi:hypothetical protein
MKGIFLTILNLGIAIVVMLICSLSSMAFGMYLDKRYDKSSKKFSIIGFFMGIFLIAPLIFNLFQYFVLDLRKFH